MEFPWYVCVIALRGLTVGAKGPECGDGSTPTGSEGPAIRDVGRLVVEASLTVREPAEDEVVHGQTDPGRQLSTRHLIGVRSRSAGARREDLVACAVGETRVRAELECQRRVDADVECDDLTATSGCGCSTSKNHPFLLSLLLGLALLARKRHAS